MPDGYCWTCGWHTSDMTQPAGLDPATAMCRWCREHWRPAGPPEDEEEPWLLPLKPR